MKDSVRKIVKPIAQLAAVAALIGIDHWLKGVAAEKLADGQVHTLIKGFLGFCYAENTGAAYPHLLPSLEMYRNVIAQIQAVPTTFFLNGEGEMVGQAYVGARDYSDWKEIIQEQLNGL